MPDQTLGNFTVTWLVKFFRQQLENFPITFFPQLEVDEIVVGQKLTVADRVDFKAYSNVLPFGSPGAPPLTNAWVAYGSPYAAPGFTRLPDGWIALIGAAKSGTVGSALTTLPPGARPETTQSLLTLSGGTLGRVDIQNDGQVIPVSPSVNSSVVLDGLRFKAA